MEWIAGASALAGIATKFIPGMGGGAPAGPAISSAPGGVISAPFNVGGGLGGVGQIGALGGWLPYIAVGVVAWLLLKK